jgi:hypothetical protein
LPLDRQRYNQVIAPSGFTTGQHDLANDFVGQRRGDTSAQSMRLTWKGPGVDVVGVVANREFKGPYAFDFDYTPIAAPNTPGLLGQVISDSAYNTKNRYYELRAQSSQEVGLRWVVGASRSEQSVQVLSDGVFPVLVRLCRPVGALASTMPPVRATTKPCSAKPRGGS